VKVLHVISGGETGGSRKHLITLLSKFPKDEVALVVFQEGQLSNEAQEAGIDVHVIKQTSRYDLSILKRLTQFINEGSYEILHTHGPRANLFGAFIKNKIKALWVTTIHSDPKLDFIKTGIKGKLFTTLNLYAIRKIEYFFAVSERFKENLVSLGIPGKKVKTIYNGIEFQESPTTQTLTRQDIGVSDEDFVITMVARLHPIKGHELVFNSLKEIQHQNVKLVLVGNGPIEDELKSKVKELKLDAQVIFLGFRQDVDNIYKVSDVSLLASYSESFPLALLEAANQQVPLITTDVGGVKQLVIDDTLGWIVPTGDSNELKEAIKDAYDRKKNGTLKEMGEKQYEYASSHFSLDNLYKEIKNTYQQLLERRN
jgi:L-malate glycosyltransferase